MGRAFQEAVRLRPGHGYEYGENSAYGFRTPAATVRAWMRSPGHRANILNSIFRETGVGLTSPGSIYAENFLVKW